MSLWRSLLGVKEEVADESLPASLREIMGSLDGLPAQEARYLAAFAFILGRVANADLDISSVEIASMERIIAELGHLGGSRARLVVQLVSHHQELVGGTDNYLVTREFKQMSSPEQRIELLHCLFAVSAADGDISLEEEAAIRTIATELGFATSEYVTVRRGYNDMRSVVKRLRASS